MEWWIYMHVAYAYSLGQNKKISKNIDWFEKKFNVKFNDSKATLKNRQYIIL